MKKSFMKKKMESLNSLASRGNIMELEIIVKPKIASS